MKFGGIIWNELILPVILIFQKIVLKLCIKI